MLYLYVNYMSVLLRERIKSKICFDYSFVLSFYLEVQYFKEDYELILIKIYGLGCFKFYMRNWPRNVILGFVTKLQNLARFSYQKM